MQWNQKSSELKFWEHDCNEIRIKQHKVHWEINRGGNRGWRKIVTLKKMFKKLFNSKKRNCWKY